MPSLATKDRVSLCRFTFDDGRRCRTPRISTSPDFCFYHAQKEAQLRANERLAEDLAYFFSSDYLSANDLNTALSHVFVAVARGDIKPRAARTLAYLAQTMLQTLHLAQNELITACGEKDWRDTVVNSINANQAYRFPSPSQSAPPQTPAQPTMPAQPESAAPHSQIPLQPPTPSQPPTPPPPTPPPPPPPRPTPSTLATPPQACHPERSEGSRLDSTSPTAANTRLAAAPPAPTPHAAYAAPDPASQPNPPAPQTPKPTAPPSAQPAAPPRSTTQTRDPYAIHYGPNQRLFVDGKPFSEHT